jgi:hypothetical protein
LEDLRALRRQAGLRIEPETAEVEWVYGRTLDPYGDFPNLPEELRQIGREDEEGWYFDFERIVPVPAFIRECQVSFGMLMEAFRRSDGTYDAIIPIPKVILEKSQKSKEIDSDGWFYVFGNRRWWIWDLGCC